MVLLCHVDASKANHRVLVYDHQARRLFPARQSDVINRYANDPCARVTSRGIPPYQGYLEIYNTDFLSAQEVAQQPGDGSLRLNQVGARVPTTVRLRQFMNPFSGQYTTLFVIHPQTRDGRKIPC